MSVYLLDGAARAVDTEDAAVQCHELAPKLFSWQKYPEQINLELVRVSLSDAKKQKHGELLAGSGKEGWRLTARGLDWMGQTGQALLATQLQSANKGRSKAGSIDARRKERERNRILAVPGWRDWEARGAVDPRTAREVFRVDEYTTAKMLAIKVSRLRAMFEADEQLSPFLIAAAQMLSTEVPDGR